VDSPHEKYITTMGVLGVQETARAAQLEHYASFCAGTQHDHHTASWDGVPRDPGIGYLHERLRPQGFVPVNSVPQTARRPDSSVPLARQIVSRFTEMLLGAGRTPSLCVDTDEATQAYLASLAESSTWWEALGQARDLAGACGCAAVALGLVDGAPTHEVLHPQDLWVPEWDQLAPGWRPQVVVHQRKVQVEVQDKVTGRLGMARVWRTEAWTPTEIVRWPDLTMAEAQDLADAGQPWPAPERTAHGAGVCPVVWVQNTLDTARPEGAPDCEGVWHLLDQVDRLQSAACRAVQANVNPLLVLQDDAKFRDRGQMLRKGPNGVIRVGAAGSVKYLEMTGGGVASAAGQVAELTSQILQTVECVVITPESAKAYQSGEALQILWRSMESRASRLRVQVEAAIRDWARIWLSWGRAIGVSSTESPVEGHLVLPPVKVTTDPEPPEPGDQEGEGPFPDPDEDLEPTVTWEAQDPGKGQYVRLEWPPYWSPTPAQIFDMFKALSLGAGGTQLISSGTATRVASQYLGQDPESELGLVEDEKADREAKAQAIFEGMGGQGPGDPEDDEGEDQEAGGPPGPPVPGEEA